MLETAKRSLHDGNYDIAAFMVDQAVQLYLKSEILEFTGEIPRLHAVRQLLRILGVESGQEGKVNVFIKEKRGILARLEDAYIGSRYVAREYEREEAEELIEFAREVIEFVEHLKGQTGT